MRFSVRAVLCAAVLCVVSASVAVPGRELAGAAPRQAHALGGDLLSSAVVESVYSQLWPQLVGDALAHPKALLRIVTRGALQVLIANTLCQCDAMFVPPVSHELTAPVETSYPLSFLAEIDLPKRETVVDGVKLKGSSVLFAIFEQASSQSPWILAYLSGYGGLLKTLAPTGPATMESVAPAGFPTSNHFTQLVQALQSARQNGTVPSSNAWSRETTAGTEPYETIHELEAQHLSDGLFRSKFEVHYSLASHSRTFMTPVGVLQCAEIFGTGNYSHGRFVQPADQSAYPTLKPGTYSSVTIQSARDVCIIDDFSGEFRLASLNGGTFGAYGTLVH